jgi:hypothetical protein
MLTRPTHVLAFFAEAENWAVNLVRLLGARCFGTMEGRIRCREGTWASIGMQFEFEEVDIDGRSERSSAVEPRVGLWAARVHSRFSTQRSTHVKGGK